MLTPKEKAQELVEKFRISKAITESYAKQCSLIAVDEMIEQNGDFYLNSLGDKTIAFYKAKNVYLFEVKQEINNL